MAGLTLTQKKSLLAEYLKAETKILKGQSYTIKDRTLERADLRWVQAERRRLSEEIEAEEGSRKIRSRRAVPRDL